MAAQPRPCVLDASLLITFGEAARLDVLSKTPDFTWYIGPLSRGELRKPQTRAPVEQAILDGVIQVVDLDSDDATALALFVEWAEIVDPGEAECIALALARGWKVALEDRAAQRLLDRRAGPGHWLNCVNVLTSAVRSGTLDLAEGDEVFQALDVYGGYAKRGIRSLQQIDTTL